MAGFTIIELTLALAFISVLLLSITLVSIQVGKIYNRGVTLRDINQAARDISDTLRRDFMQTNAQRIMKDGTNEVIWIRNGGQDVSGRICLGDYSYVWNMATALDSGDTSGVFMVDGSPVTLVRAIDKGGNLCTKQNSGEYPQTIDAAKISHLLKKTSTGEGSIVVHAFGLEKISQSDTAEELYRISFTLGTGVLSEINTSDATCKPPDDDQANLDFCAINKFVMIARTNG